MKKVKKTLASFVLVFQVLSLTAGAATIDSVKTDARKVTVEGKSGEKVVTYKVYSKASSGESVSDICEMGEAYVANGEFLIEFKMPKHVHGEGTGGEYVVTVMGEKADSGEFFVMDYSTQEDFIKKLDGNDINLVELFDSNLAIMKNLGADTTYYEGLEEADKEILAGIFLAEKDETKVTIDNFSVLFRNAIRVKYINANKASAEWFDDNGFMFEGVSFGEITDEALKTWILQNVNGVITETSKYNTYSEIEKKYREPNVLYKLNNAKHTEYEEIITSYDDVIEIIKEDYYQDYLDMKATYKNKVGSEVKNSIAKTPVSNAEDFKDIYEAAVKKVKKSMNSSSSGGGSSSSSGGMSVIVPEITNPIKAQSKFNDLINVDWAKDAIEGLAAKGVVAGYNDNSFKPQKNITREEFIKMVVAAQGVRLNASPCGLSDVDQNAWYAPYVNAAYQAGIVKGVSEKEFGIGKEITREDMAVIIARLKNYAGAEVQGTFADEANIASYAKDAVYSLYNAGKIAGVGNNMFGPKQIVNRAQAAKIIYDTMFSGI